MTGSGCALRSGHRRPRVGRADAVRKQLLHNARLRAAVLLVAGVRRLELLQQRFGLLRRELAPLLVYAASQYSQRRDMITKHRFARHLSTYSAVRRQQCTDAARQPWARTGLGCSDALIRRRDDFAVRALAAPRARAERLAALQPPLEAVGAAGEG